MTKAKEVSRMNRIECQRYRVRDVLTEITKGVGPSWQQYRVVGATRDGIAPAKAAVGKTPERYKPVHPGTVFYNPMRILIGSIAMIGDGEPSGITSPDYVVMRAVEDKLDPGYFYHWLRSAYGEQFIKSHARGAVRERLTFARLADAEISVPPIEWQRQFSTAMLEVSRGRAAACERLELAGRLTPCLHRDVFDDLTPRPLGDLLWGIEAGKSLRCIERQAAPHELGVLKVSAVSWGDLRASENKVLPDGYLPEAHHRLRAGDLLFSRSNTSELVGAVVFVRQAPDNLVLSDKTLRLKCREEVDPEYLELVLRSAVPRRFIEGEATGSSSSMRNLSQEKIARIPIPWMAKADQHALITKLKSESAHVALIAAAARVEMAMFDAIPGRMLAHVFGTQLEAAA